VPVEQIVMNQHLPPLFEGLQETAHGVHVRESLEGGGSLSLSFSLFLSQFTMSLLRVASEGFV
jgi:hypothetical protein